MRMALSCSWLQPVVGGNGQRVERRLVDLAGDDQAVAGLEQADGGIGRWSNSVVDLLLGRHVAADHQPALERSAPTLRLLPSDEVEGFLGIGSQPPLGDERLVLRDRASGRL